ASPHRGNGGQQRAGEIVIIVTATGAAFAAQPGAAVAALGPRRGQGSTALVAVIDIDRAIPLHGHAASSRAKRATGDVTATLPRVHQQCITREGPSRVGRADL